MRPSSILVALAVVATGCMPNPAVLRFRSEFGCTSGEATALGRGAYLVEGCGVDASYVCEEQEGGSTICVRESGARTAARRVPDADPRPVREARLSLEDSQDAVRLRFEVPGAPTLVYAPAQAPRTVLVTSEADPCPEARIRGSSGATLAGAAVGEDEAGFTWPLTDLARFTSEDAIWLTLCGDEIELRGTEMQSFRGFVGRAGELRPTGGGAGGAAAEGDVDGDADEGDAAEADAAEGDAAEGDAAEGDAAEGDAAESDAAEAPGDEATTP